MGRLLAALLPAGTQERLSISRQDLSNRIITRSEQPIGVGTNLMQVVAGC